MGLLIDLKQMATSQSERTTQQLEQALSEAHHRVKNTIQNVLSYIHVMFQNRDFVTKQDIGKLTTYLRSLSTIHDLLLEEITSFGNDGTIRLDRIITDLVELFSIQHTVRCDYVPAISTTPRIAATVALIVTELLDNAVRFDSKTEIPIISLELSPDGTQVILDISNSYIPSDQGAVSAPGNGIRIVELLCKADLRCKPQFTSDDRLWTASIKFTLP